MVGTVTIGSVDRGAVAEAERQIRLILNPPTADVGQVYKGRVVNITKFGAFVNILPGRDGLVHISKLGGGKRIEKVEDVVSLGDEIEVRVDDVDPNGKVSLSRDLGCRSGGDGVPSVPSTTVRPRLPPTVGVEVVSFEDAFDAEVREEFGDLGPAAPASADADRGGDRGPRRGGDRGGRRGGGRR